MLKLYLFFFNLFLYVIIYGQGVEEYLNGNKLWFQSTTEVDKEKLSHWQFENYQMFLIGEVHDMDGNEEIQIDALKYFYEREGVRTVFFEFPYSTSEALNNYIINSDSISYFIIKKVFREKQVKLIEAIHDLNTYDYENDKITAMAVDREFHWNFSIYSLSKLLPREKTIPNQLNSSVLRLNLITDESFLGNKYMSERKYRRFAKKFAKNFYEHNIEYKTYLGDNYNKFKIILDGFVMGVNYSKASTVKEYVDKREAFMYNNCRSFLSSNPKTKVFGQFGLAHTSIDTIESFMYEDRFVSVATMLNKFSDSPIQGEVCSFLINYSKVKDKRFIKKEHYPLFYKHSTTPLTLFKLDGDGTPFKEMSEKFQYIIINKY